MASGGLPRMGSLRHPSSSRSYLSARAGCCLSACCQGMYPCSREPGPGCHHHRRHQQQRQQQQRRRPGRSLAPVKAVVEEVQRGLVLAESQSGWLAGLGKPVLQSTLASLLAYLAAAWPDRPRGWSRKDLLEVRESPIQGLGVFAKRPIAAATVLGAYPGRPRSPTEMAAKIAATPAAAAYCFQNGRGQLLDPTDRSGEPSARPAPGLAWLPVDATLCRVNEPPAGSAGPNVEIQDDPRDPHGILFVASRVVAPGEELWIDYGPAFDRSKYEQG
ncbi:hypothetical protein N2152v2_003867 [Parachlorella kessleri]